MPRTARGRANGSWGRPAEINLPCDFLSARVARRFVGARLQGRYPDSLIEAAELVASEVVTRMVVHGCTTLTMKLTDADDPASVALTVTYRPSDEATADRVPGPVAPRLARRATRIDIDARTICHEFVLDEASARAAG